MYTVKDYSGSSSKPPATVKHVESFDPNSPRGGQLVDINPYDNHGDEDGRPIRPKQNPTYNDRDPDLENDVAVAQPAAVFPPGQHPLQDVPNFAELPEPEANMTTKAK